MVKGSNPDVRRVEIDGEGVGSDVLGVESEGSGVEFDGERVRP